MKQYPNLSAELSRRDLTYKAIAPQIGVAESTFSNWMNGKTKPNVNQAIAMSDILCCDLRYLFSEDQKAEVI